MFVQWARARPIVELLRKWDSVVRWCDYVIEEKFVVNGYNLTWYSKVFCRNGEEHVWLASV